jgi:hypothetical protein
MNIVHSIDIGFAVLTPAHILHIPLPTHSRADVLIACSAPSSLPSSHSRIMGGRCVMGIAQDHCDSPFTTCTAFPMQLPGPGQSTHTLAHTGTHTHAYDFINSLNHLQPPLTSQFYPHHSTILLEILQ